MRQRVQLLPVKKTAKQEDTLDWMSGALEFKQTNTSGTGS